MRLVEVNTMGYVELRDGTMNRRIRVPNLKGHIEIDVSVPDDPAVTICGRVEQ